MLHMPSVPRASQKSALWLSVWKGVVAKIRSNTEGNMYTSSGGHLTGLVTDAVTSSSPSVESFYDFVVIGAGFAGLVAARDLSKDTGLDILLVEARDRLVVRHRQQKPDVDFEMGGTWVHW